MGSIKPTKTKRGYFGKVESSLNEKLETVEWGEFKFNDKLFNLCKVKRKLNKSELDAHGCVPVYSSESTNNGIIGYTNQKPEFLINNENHVYVVFGDHTRSFNIAKSSFCVADNTKVLRIENPRISDKSLMFINSSWKKSIPDKGYSRHWSTAQRVAFKLPTKDGKPDFEFMESFIAELEAERIAELEAYLTATGLKDYELTPQEQKAIDNYQNIEFIDFKVTDIFTVKNTGNILSRDIIENSGNTPYLCASRENNSVSSYISYNSEYLENGNCIFIGGKTFVVTYQEYDFYSNDSHNLILYLNDENNRDKFTQLYLATCINKSLGHKYSWGDSISNKKIQNDRVALPVNNDQPDLSLMATLISAIQKLVIKDVVLFSERKITAHKQVVQS